MGVEKITISNDSSRLSPEEVKRVEAKNGLENYAYSLKNSMQEEGLKQKLPDDDRETVTKACDEVIAWMDANQAAEKEEFEFQRKELESTTKPIMQKAYAGVSSADVGGATEPRIDEVD